MSQDKEMDSAPEEDGDEIFEVECISAAKWMPLIDKDGKPLGDSCWWYMVRWYKYTRKDDTYQPEENFEGDCDELIESFWDHVIKNEEKKDRRKTYKAKKSWIREWTRRFRANKRREENEGIDPLAGQDDAADIDEAEEESDRAEDDVSPDRSKASASRSPAVKRKSPTSESSPEQLKIRNKRPRKNPLRVDEGDDSDDDHTPLAVVKGRASGSSNASPIVTSRSLSPFPKASKASSLGAQQKPPPASAVSSAVKGPRSDSAGRSPLEKNISLPDPKSAPAPNINKHRGAKLRILGDAPPLPPEPLKQGRFINGKRVTVTSSTSKDAQQTSAASTSSNAPSKPLKPPVRAGTTSDITAQRANILKAGGKVPRPKQQSATSPPKSPIRTMTVPVSPKAKRKFSATSPPQPPQQPMLPETSTFVAEPMDVDPLPPMLSPAESGPSTTAVPITPSVEEFLQNLNLTSSTPMMATSHTAGATSGNLFTQEEEPWSGTMLFQFSREKAMELGVRITNGASIPGSRVLLTQSAIIFGGTSSAEDLLIRIRPAFDPISTLAKVEGTSEMDKRKASRLATYLLEASRVSLSPMKAPNGRLRDHSVLLFPSALSSVTEALGVPPSWVEGPNTLLVGVWKQLYPKDLSSAYRSARPPPPTRSLVPIDEKDRWQRLPDHLKAVYPELEKLPLDKQFVFQRSIKALGITDEQAKLFTKRIFCMYPDEANEKLDVESRDLFAVLQEVLKAQRVAVEDSKAQIVFIHAKGRRHLGNMPKFLDRKSTAPQVTFYTYGWDPGFDPSLVQLRSIYRIGGILSFSPMSLLHDQQDLESVMARKDPFWQLYSTMDVLGFLDEVARGTDSRLAGSAKRAIILLHPLIGKKTPDGPIRLTLGLPGDDPLAWAYEQLHMSDLGLVDVLKKARKGLREKYIKYFPQPTAKPASSTVPPTADSWGSAGNDGWGTTSASGWGDIGGSDWGLGDGSTSSTAPSATPTTPAIPAPAPAPVNAPAPAASEKEEPVGLTPERTMELGREITQSLIEDLQLMQIHPALDSYRRFVLLMDGSEDMLKNNNSGIEMTQPSQFLYGFPPQPLQPQQ